MSRDLEHKKAYQKEYYLKNKEVLTSYRKKHYSNNREKMLLRSKDWSKNNPDARKANVLKSAYNMTLDEYNIMFDNQKGACLCCGIHQSKIGRVLNVDHCHVTGKVRGLLCNKCNSALGFVNDNIQTLNNMIEYLTINKP